MRKLALACLLAAACVKPAEGPRMKPEPNSPPPQSASSEDGLDCNNLIGEFKAAFKDASKLCSMDLSLLAGSITIGCEKEGGQKLSASLHHYFIATAACPPSEEEKEEDRKTKAELARCEETILSSETATERGIAECNSQAVRAANQTLDDACPTHVDSSLEPEMRQRFYILKGFIRDALKMILEMIQIGACKEGK